MFHIILRRSSNILGCSCVTKFQCFSSSVFTRRSVLAANRWNSGTTKMSDDWLMLYKLPMIRMVRLLSRAKLAQVLLMGVICIPLYDKYKKREIEKKAFSYALLGCAGTLFVLIIFSLFSTRLVGHLSYSYARNQIRISRLSFLGSKKNDYFNVNNIIPWTDCSDNIEEHLHSLYIHTSENKTVRYFYVPNSRSIVKENKDLFHDILGIPTK